MNAHLPASGLRSLADTRTPAPLDRSLIELFAEVAAAHADRPAVGDGRRSLTYAELDRAAAALADRLERGGAAPGGKVGILLDRSIENLAAILAVLDCGATYVPLDPSLPAERLEAMLDDLGHPPILTRRGLQNRLPATVAPAAILLVDDQEFGAQPAPASDRIRFGSPAGGEGGTPFGSGSPPRRPESGPGERSSLPRNRAAARASAGLPREPTRRCRR